MTTGYKKPKNPKVKFDLQPREEGEAIEDWIMRETERLAKKDWRCKEFRERIKRQAEVKAEAGTHSAMMNAELQKLQAENRRKIKEIKATEEKFRKQKLLPARAKMRKESSEHKSMLAKSNTMHKRFFNAVKVRVFQNMRSLCNIQHTWADPKVKRNLQNSDEELKKRRVQARAPLKEMERLANAEEEI
jgi:hypothetical protein